MKERRMKVEWDRGEQRGMEEIRMGRRKVETEGAKQSGMDERGLGQRKVVWVDEGEWDRSTYIWIE